MGFKIADTDIPWIVAGSVTDALASWMVDRMTKEPGSETPPKTLVVTAFIGIPALALAYTGLNNPGKGAGRNLAAFLFGVGTSRAFSYVMSRTGITENVGEIPPD